MPSKVKIGGLIYQVEIVDKLDKDTTGEVDFQKQIIRIEKAKEEFMKETFLHEILHAMNSERDEEDTEALAMDFYAFIVDNPTVFNRKGGEIK